MYNQEELSKVLQTFRSRRGNDLWRSTGSLVQVHSDTAFSIVIPPPNVTAALHLGHALNNTLQDVLAGSTVC